MFAAVTIGALVLQFLLEKDPVCSPAIQNPINFLLEKLSSSKL